MVPLKTGTLRFRTHTALCTTCAQRFMHHPLIKNGFPDHPAILGDWIRDAGLRFWSPRSPHAPTWIDRYAEETHIVISMTLEPCREPDCDEHHAPHTATPYSWPSNYTTQYGVTKL